MHSTPESLTYYRAKNVWRESRPLIYKAWKDLDGLVEAGYMDMDSREVHGIPDYRSYWLNRKGLDWLGEQIGIYIYDEED